MTTYKITKNGKDLISGLSQEDAFEKLLPVVEDYSNGYIYDNEDESIYNEVDGKIIAQRGDDYVLASDDLFEVVEDTEE